jgi:predicted Zn-dependent peptidase
MRFKKTTLPNGLRIITAPNHGNPAVTVLVMVETGSNYEEERINGLSHFLEHMCFKGTTNRPNAIDISKELDNLGGQHNAFTGDEYTGYYAKAEKKHFKEILNILADMYLNPTFPDPELQREKGVILQEISMNEDFPHVQVWHDFMKLLYGDTPAGRPTLGPAKNIKRFTREDFVEYRNKHYVSKATTIVVAGDINEKTVINEIKKEFKNISQDKKHTKEKVRDNQKSPSLLVHNKKTDQTHMILGFRAYDASNKKIPTLNVLTSVIGKGMSSRLFQKLRNEMGVCYYVRGEADPYTDHGYFAISTGVDKKRTEEVIKVLLEEVKKLSNELVSDEELNKAKEYLIGNLYLNLETSDSQAEFYALQEVVTGKIKNPQDIEKEIRKVTAKDVQKIAKEIFQNKNLNLAIVGEVKNKQAIKKALSI